MIALLVYAPARQGMTRWVAIHGPRIRPIESLNSLSSAFRWAEPCLKGRNEAI
jgi:hypothetical protein